MTLPPLLLLLLLLPPLVRGGPERVPPGAAGPMPAPAAPVASGGGSLRRQAGEALVGTAGPCGKPGQAHPVLLQVLGLSGGSRTSWSQQLRPDPHHDPHLHPPTPTALHRHGPAATSPAATSTSPTDQLSTAERYALASAAGLVVALAPLLALGVLHCPLCHRAQRWLQPLLMGLASGTLSGDSLLHLLPQLLGFHHHAEGSQAGGSSTTPTPSASTEGAGGEGPPWVMLGVLGGLYGTFLLEKLLSILLPPGGEGGPRCHHVEHELGVSSSELVKMEDAPQPPPELQSRGLPWRVALGSAIHSLADGLALGAAFTHSWRSGTATALALLGHELPHALGSLAVLARAGLGTRRVLALGLGGSLPVLPGLYAGLALGAAGPARTWLGALATGVLLHLALSDMVPAMLAARDKHPWVLLGLQSVGLLAGWGLLLGLALAEETLPQ